MIFSIGFTVFVLSLLNSTSQGFVPHSNKNHLTPKAITGVPKYLSDPALRSCDYCSISSGNTYCLYHSVSATCQTVYNNDPFNADQIQTILDLHNHYRRMVANGQQNGLPSGADMRELTWSDELARGAQLWADQCQFGHDSQATCKHSWVGQNLYVSGTWGELTTREDAMPDFDPATKAWYDEVSLFYGNVDQFSFSHSTGHFTQMIWADTYEVGCGFIAHKGYPGAGDQYSSKFYACNYGPGGNMMGVPIYQRGSPCSACPDGYKVCKNGLCSATTASYNPNPNSNSNNNNNDNNNNNNMYGNEQLPMCRAA